jgi:hypothetical protein
MPSSTQNGSAQAVPASANGTNKGDSIATKRPIVAVNGKQVTVSTHEGTALRQAQIAAAGNPLDGLTLPQALTWIDSNVSDLASARTTLKHLVKLIFVIKAEANRSK